MRGKFLTLIALCPHQGGGGKALSQNPLQSSPPLPQGPPRGWPMTGVSQFMSLFQGHVTCQNLTLKGPL